MTPDQYNFNGDFVTFLGLIGVASTLLIMVTAFKRFYNSPYNVRVTPKQVAPETSAETETPAS